MIIIAYLLGSIPSAVWIGKKYYGIDIREYGSKNAGTTNMLRVLGRRAALPVFGLDFLKGFGGGDDHRPDEIRQRIRRRGQ